MLVRLSFDPASGFVGPASQCKINEVDIAKIKDGLPVEIRPDAFSERSFKGVVHKIANLAVNKDSKSKVKVFPVN